MAPVKSPLRTVLVATLVVAAVGCGSRGPSAERRPAQPQSVRVYVFDGGTLRVPDPSRFQLRKEEIAESDLAVSCFLIAHPKGTLLWDTCAVPDGEWTPTSSPVTHHMVLADSQEREVTIRKSLRSQLAAGSGRHKGNTCHVAKIDFHEVIEMEESMLKISGSTSSSVPRRGHRNRAAPRLLMSQEGGCNQIVYASQIKRRAT